MCGQNLAVLSQDGFNLEEPSVEGLKPLVDGPEPRHDGIELCLRHIRTPVGQKSFRQQHRILHPETAYSILIRSINSLYHNGLRV